MAQIGNICFRSSPARFLDGQSIVSAFIAQRAHFNLPAGSRFAFITSTSANDAVLADVRTRLSGTLEEQVLVNTISPNIVTTENADGSTTRRVEERITSTRTIYTIPEGEDYVTPPIDDEDALSFSGLNSGLSMQIWGNGNPDTPAEAVVREGGDFDPIEIESVVTLEGSELDSDAWFTRRIVNLANVRRIEFDLDCSVYNTDNDGNATPRSALVAAEIRYAGESTFRRLLVGDGILPFGNQGLNFIRITGDENDGGRGRIAPVIETAANPVARISDPASGDSFPAAYRITNSNFNNARFTVILPDFTSIEQSLGSLEIRFRSEARDQGGRNRNAITLRGIKVVRNDTPESIEDYLFQHRIGMNLVASSTLSGTPEAANALIETESLHWDPNATFAEPNTLQNRVNGEPVALEVIYQLDANGNIEVDPDTNLFVRHPDNATLTRDSNGNVAETDLPSDGDRFAVGYWSMNNPRYWTYSSDGVNITGLSSGAFRHTSNPAELLLTFALGQRATGRPGAVNNSRLIWGLGLPISQIDLDSITDWLEYCAENELEFSGNFNRNRTAFEILDALAAPGHGLISWADGRLSIAVDEAYAAPSFVLDESKISAGSMRIQYEMRRKFDGIEAVINDRDEDFRETTIREDVEPAFRSTGAIANERFFGITSVNQARDYARRYIRHNTYRTTIYEFRLPASEFFLTIGDVILMKHRIFGDDNFHKLKVFAVRYSSAEEITISAASDSFRVWLDRNASVENTLIDFSNDLPWVLPSRLYEDNFIEMVSTALPNNQGNNVWQGELNVLHNGQDMRLRTLTVREDGGRQMISFGFPDFRDPSFGRGATSTAFEYAGISTEEPSNDDVDGATWVFSEPLNFTYQSADDQPVRNFSITRVSFDAAAGTLTLRDLRAPEKPPESYNGLLIQMRREGQLAGVATVNVQPNFPVTFNGSDVVINLSSQGVSNLIAARNESLFLRLSTRRQAVSETRAATGRVDNDDVIYNFSPIQFDAEVSGSTNSYTITGVSFNSSTGTMTIFSPDFLSEATTPEADQLLRLSAIALRFEAFRGGLIGQNRLIFWTPTATGNTFEFSPGQLTITFSNLQTQENIETFESETPVMAFRVQAGGVIRNESDPVEPMNLFQPTGTTYTLFPNVEFSDNNNDFRFSSVEFVDQPGAVRLILIDDLIAGKNVSDYHNITLRVGNTRVALLNQVTFIDADGDDVPGGTEGETSFRVEVEMSAQDATDIRAAIAQNPSQVIGFEINGVTQPPTDPLARALRETIGDPLILELTRYEGEPDPDSFGSFRVVRDADGNPIVRRDANGNEERVPLRITQVSDPTSRQLRINAEALDGRNIRYLTPQVPGLPENPNFRLPNTVTRVEIPRAQVDNIKVPLGAVYEGRCPVYLPDTNHARILLARGNAEADPMLDEIERVADAEVARRAALDTGDANYIAPAEATRLTNEDLDFFSIDVYRNPVQVGNADVADNEYALIFRGSEKLATLFRSGFRLVIGNQVFFGMRTGSTEYVSANVEGGAGVVLSVEDEIRSGIGGSDLPDSVVETRAMERMESALGLLTVATSVHIQILRGALL